MPSARHRIPFISLLFIPAALRAQASPYLPLDDERLPALEYLISRGAIEDPSPLVRPFRRADAVRVLTAADTAQGGVMGRMIHLLHTELNDGDGEARWRVEPRAGTQAFSHARGDPLHPAGKGAVRPYAELGLELVAGSLALVSRPAIETRLLRDPDWPGRKNIEVTGRHVEGYISAQFRWADLFFGQMDQNWGPTGVPGIGLSDYSYPRPAVGFTLHTRDVRLNALASELHDTTDTLGQTVKRYYFAHRLAARLTDRLNLGLWETAVLSGVDRSFDGRYRNPVTLLLLGNQYGLGDDGNVLVGFDVNWRVWRRTLLSAQFGLDDFQYKNRSGPTRIPNRYAFTLALSGPLARSAAWRALYTQASSLAFRDTDPFDNFTDNGVGLGRSFADNDQLSAWVTLPATPRWLTSLELTLLRQGQGDINIPLPATPPAFGSTPTLFIGTVERTWRAALGLSGRQGPLRLSANAGFHHISNLNHQPGRSADRFEGRLSATLGLRFGGTLK